MMVQARAGHCTPTHFLLHTTTTTTASTTDRGQAAQ